MNLPFKIAFCFALVFAVTRTNLPAAPLSSEQISANAHWVIHFDAERFRRTKIGAHFEQTTLEHLLDEAKTNTGYDLGPFFHSLKSVTAYGIDFRRGSRNTGVMLLQSDTMAVDNIQQILALRAAGDRKTIKQLQAKPFVLFRIDDTFVVTLDGGKMLLGSSTNSVCGAAEVLTGSRKSLRADERFKDLAQTGECFFVAGVEGFNEKEAHSPSFGLLKKIESGRALVSERDENLTCELSLGMTNEKAAEQAKEFIERLFEWAGKSKSKDKDLQALLQSATLALDGKKIAVSFRYPVARALENMADAQVEKSAVKKTSTR